jgi:5-bromo-4-chloroindolyl phosphate hydrolysis protein
MKTVCVLLLGWILFDSTLTFKNILGMLLAIVGMVVYSWAVETEKARQKAAMTKTSMTEEEIRLIKEDVVIETKPLKDLELGDSKAYKV